MLSKSAGQRTAGKLTIRQLLTQRSFWVVGCTAVVVAAGGAVAVNQSMPDAASELKNGPAMAGQSENAAAGQGGATGQARLLKVSTMFPRITTPPEMQEGFTGIVRPRRSSNLAAKALGRVDRVMVDVGDTVAAGQVLLQLDEDQLEAELQVSLSALAAAESQMKELEAGPRLQDIEQAEARVVELTANLKLGQANLDRTELLRESRAISVQELDENRFRVDALRAQLDSANQQLELLREGTRAEQLAAQRNTVASLRARIDQVRVRLAEQKVIAPYAGQVQGRLVDEGDVVSPGQSMLQIVESNELEVHVGLPAGIAAELEDGSDGSASRVEIVTTSRDLKLRRGLTAVLERMSPSLDSATRTRQCIFRIAASASPSVVIGDAVQVFVRRDTVADERTGAASRSTWIPARALSAGPRGLWNIFIASPLGQERNDQERAGQAIGTEQPDSTRNGSSVDGTSGGVNSGGVAVIEQRPVELLRSYGKWAEVRGALQPQEQLVVEGVHRVVVGQRVQTVLIQE